MDLTHVSTPGGRAEYDFILSVSQEPAMQRHLLVLENERISISQPVLHLV